MFNVFYLQAVAALLEDPLAMVAKSQIDCRPTCLMYINCTQIMLKCVKQKNCTSVTISTFYVSSWLLGAETSIQQTHILASPFLHL